MSYLPIDIKLTCNYVTLRENRAESDKFKISTSSEALHYAIWQGQPLVGNQLWRQYYYLDYAVEPSCVDKDFD